MVKTCIYATPTLHRRQGNHCETTTPIPISITEVVVLLPSETPSIGGHCVVGSEWRLVGCGLETSGVQYAFQADFELCDPLKV